MARHAHCSDAGSVYHVLNRAVGRALATADSGSVGPGILLATPGKAKQGQGGLPENLTPFLSWNGAAAFRIMNRPTSTTEYNTVFGVASRSIPQPQTSRDIL